MAIFFCIEIVQAQLVAQSIGQAFHVAYLEFLKANGIESPGNDLGDVDYQDVLNQQQVFGEELNMFANKEMQKEVCWALVWSVRTYHTKKL